VNALSRDWSAHRYKLNQLQLETCEVGEISW